MAKLVLVTEVMRTVAGSTGWYEISGANLLVPRDVSERVCFGLVCAWSGTCKLPVSCWSALGTVLEHIWLSCIQKCLSNVLFDHSVL